jgi:hypothetical protein
MAGTLIAHKGAVRIEKTQLMQIEAPQPTKTWRPIPHGTLVNTLGDVLSSRGLAVKREEYAIQRNGNILFGVMDLVWGGTVEYYAALGLRTSNNKSFAIQIAIGARVIVCDNLLLSGELIALKRKHTAKLDLMEELTHAIRRYELGYQHLEKGIQRLKQCEMSLTETREMLFNVFAARIVPVKLFHHVAAPYIRTPDRVTLIPVWEVHNTFTNALKKLPPGVAFDANVKLGKFFGLN